MKKFSIAILAFVAMMSFGGNIAAVHAETLTPDQAAQISQTIDALKTRLAALQAEAAAAGNTATPSTPATLAPSVSLSSSDAAALNAALGTLATALTNLQTEIAAHPEMTAGREAAMLTALKGIGGTLTNIAMAASGQPLASKAPVASTENAQPSVATIAPSTPSSESTGGGAVAEAPATAPAQAGTAEVASKWSLKGMNWPLVIVIGLIVLAMALWLFWPSDDDAKAKKVVAKNIPSPSSSKSTPSIQQAVSSINPTAKPVTSIPTPLSSAMGTPATPPHGSSSQPQQRKPA